MHKISDVGISNHGALWCRAWVHREVALEMVIPVEEVGLEVDSARKWDEGCLGAG